MQNRAILAGIAAAIIILLGAAGVFLYSKNKTTYSPNNTVATVSPTPKSSLLEGQIKDIFLTSGNKKCDFTVSDKKGDTKGTFYVSGGTKTAGEIKATSDNKTVTTNVIRNGDTFYMWGDSFPIGIKMNVSVDELTSQLSTSQKSSIDTNQKVSYKCSGWVLDASKFTPPTNIKFTSFFSPTSAKTTGTTSQCSVCNSLTGSAKTACLSQLNCSL